MRRECDRLLVLAASEFHNSRKLPHLPPVLPEEVLRQHDHELVGLLGPDFEGEPLAVLPLPLRVGQLPGRKLPVVWVVGGERVPVPPPVREVINQGIRLVAGRRAAGGDVLGGNSMQHRTESEPLGRPGVRLGLGLLHLVNHVGKGEQGLVHAQDR